MGKIDSEIKSKFTSDQHRFVSNLVYTANWVQRAFMENLKPFGISPQQFNILRILKGVGGWVPMSEIKDGLLDKAPNATRLADKLLKKELIERNRSDADRRIVYVRIAKLGLELMEEINQTENVIQKALKENISAEDAKLVSEILDKFRG